MGAKIDKHDGELAARLAKLSPVKRALLEKRLSELHVEDHAVSRIAAAVGPDYPLSYAQRRLWFFEQFSPGTPTYLVSVQFRLRGALDADALQRALDRLADRHDALRTTFHQSDADPVQRVAATGSIPMQRHRAESFEDAAARLALESRRPVDLSQRPPVRACLIEIGREDHVFQLVMHHLITDGWSIGVLNRDLAELYNSEVSSRPPVLPELPIRFADHAAWELEHANSPESIEQVEQWIRHLEGAPSLLPLPVDLRRPQRSSPDGRHVRFAIPDALRRAIDSLCRLHNLTPFAVYLAGWAAALHRNGAGDDIVIGTPFAGRGREEAANLVGLFVNTLGLRVRVSGDESFLDLAQAVRRTTLEAMPRQDAPFEKILERLDPPRLTSATPVFQTALAYLSTPLDRLEMQGLRAERLDPEDVGAHFDTTLSVDEHTDSASGRLAVRADLFESETGSRLVRHFLRSIEEGCAAPQTAVSRLQLSSEAERAELLGSWSRTNATVPGEPVHRLFERQVVSGPDRVALVEGERSLTYGELNEQSDRIAGALRAAGVQPGSIVALSLPRSIELVAAMLGVLKAGAAYLPLDVEEPAARLAVMFATVQPSACISNGKKAIGEGFLPQCPRLEIDAALSYPGPAQASHASAAGDGVYVMFTSGSTGAPKAVLAAHRGVVRLVFGSSYVRFSEAEVFLHAAAPAFDASTFELWGALLHGARCIVLPDRRPSVRQIADAVQRQRCTTAWLTSSLFNAIVDEQPDALRGLRQLVIGGEALSVPHVRRALEALPETQIVNGYGPTECVTFACCYPIPRDLASNAVSIPIGGPIANTEVYVLDRHLQPTPVGVPGELYLGGDGLALGYLGDPELTADRFIRHPFRDAPDARLYRTGDLARFLPSGLIEFRGRADDQVKIRGFRVEPGEIEAQLLAHPAVGQAAVSVHEDDEAGKRLVAHVSPASGVEAESAELARHLRSRLPSHMIPAQFVVLDALPLTRNGKVDRRALPPPGMPTPEVAEEPKGPVEAKLVEIWRQVLGVEDAGSLGDFFALGGHSLTAVRLVVRIERELERSLPVSALFEAPTPRAMAARLERSGEHDETLVPIRAGGTKSPFLCVGPGTWCRPLARRLSDDRPFLGIGLQPYDLDGLPTPHRLEDIARNFAASLLRSRPQGPYLLGGWCLDAIVAFETARQLRALGKEAPLVVLFDPSHPRRLAQLAKPMHPAVLAERFRGHVEKAANLGARDGARYLAGRVAALGSRFRWAQGMAAYERRIQRGGPSLEDVEQAVHAAASAYRAEPFDGRVALFAPSSDGPERVGESAEAWEPLAGGGLETFEVPGDHYSIFEEPSVAILAAGLEQALERH